MSDLTRQSDDELIALVAQARASPEPGARRLGADALCHLVYGHEHLVRQRLLLRVPGHLVEDMTRDVLLRAFEAAFDGRSYGEFRSFLNTILKRHVADHYRRSATDHERRAASLDGAEDARGVGPALVDVVSDRMVFRTVLESMENETHRAAVVETFLQDISPAACATRHGISVANVYKIRERFRRALQTAMDSG